MRKLLIALIFIPSIAFADTSVVRPTRIGSIIQGSTNGSVLFVSGSPAVLSQDNTNLRWNDTTNSLGIGTTPTVSIDVSGSFRTNSITLSEDTVIATDVSRANSFFVTLTGNRQLGTPTNPTENQKVIWVFSQDVTGSRTLTFSPVFRFGSTVTSPTLSTTAGRNDYIGAIYKTRGTRTSWDVVAVALGYQDI